MKIVLFFIIIPIILLGRLTAHEFNTEMRYLANEAVMITEGNSKILFDPFFHNSYNRYTLVPENIRQALFDGQAPYDNIDAIFISHAHGDHFAADDVLAFLIKHSKTRLVAPLQAIKQILALPQAKKVKTRLIPVTLDFGEQAKSFAVETIQVEAVRIPHAGWPQRADIENIVFRLTLNGKVTIMHLGDADPDDSHFLPHKSLWQKKTTDYAFPPYWFMLSSQGREILDSRLNAKNSIGIHVPTIVPEPLKQTGRKFFSKPGEIEIIEHQH